jgi:hypothetical protein
MTLTFTIKGLQESLSAIEQYKEATNPEEIASSMRAGVRDLVVDHFATVNAQRANKLGGTPRTNYWDRVGKESNITVTGNSINISFQTVGFRRHVMGGPPIRPSGKISEVTGKPIKFLTIPVTAAAHGRSVASLKASGVELYRVGGALKKQQGPTRSESDPTYFVLAKQTKAKAPDPTLLPKDEVFIRAAEEALTELEMAIKEGL